MAGNGHVLFYDRWRDHLTEWLKNMPAYFCGHGYDFDVLFGEPSLEDVSAQVSHAELVLLWNGENRTCRLIKALCLERSVPWGVVEVGFFPQRKYYVLDAKGISAHSMLMDSELDFVSDEMVRRLRRFAAGFVGEHKYTGQGGYVFCPLQLERDANIRLHSPFKSVQEFIDHAEKKFPGRKILFKIHPRDNKTYRVAHRNRIVTSASILELAGNAELVYGINSTALYEALMLGAPTIAVGNGLLRRHGKQLQRLVAALVDIQVPVTETHITYWIERYLPHFRIRRRFSLVVAAYRIDTPTVLRFFERNRHVFEMCDIEVVVVADRLLDLPVPCACCLVYPGVLPVLSLPKLINYGIRRCNHDGIIAKSDIDIVFTKDFLEYIRQQVRPGHGCVGLCANAATYEDACRSNWRRIRKRTSGFGACFALEAGDWYTLKGYNEQIFGWGADDDDVQMRASQALDMEVTAKWPLYHIDHPSRRNRFFPDYQQANLQVGPWNNEQWGEAR